MGSFKNAYYKDREAELPYFLYLAKTLCIGIKSYNKMQSYFSSPSEVYNASEERLKRTDIFTKGQVAKLMECKKSLDLPREVERLERGYIRFISIEDDEYPVRLRQIKDAPPFLFLKGKLPDTKLPCVSVIGARECSVYGANVASRLGELLSLRNIPVISGMARGVDSISQAACVSSGGFSLGVLGGGVDICYPSESRALYDKLCITGGLLSEYPPGTSPLPQYFAVRNRLISALSDAVCVIEAKERSGTLITVDCALEQGREVYALPGRITDATSFGTNDLIRQGAEIITDLEGFVDEFASRYSPSLDTHKVKVTDHNENVLSMLSESELSVLCIMEAASFTTDQLSVKTGLPAYELLGTCVRLATRGYLKNSGAGRFYPTNKGLEMRNLLISQNQSESEI